MSRRKCPARRGSAEQARRHRAGLAVVLVEGCRTCSTSRHLDRHSLCRPCLRTLPPTRIERDLTPQITRALVLLSSPDSPPPFPPCPPTVPSR